MSLDVELYFNVDTGNEEINYTVFEYNITHNLRAMAVEAGLYEALWRPEESGHTNAKDLTGALEMGLQELTDNPDRYKQFNASNGWGRYENLVKFVTEYLDACVKYPKAQIWISR